MQKVMYDIEVFKRMNMVGFLTKPNTGYIVVNAPNLPSSVHNVLGVQVYINVDKVRDMAKEKFLGGHWEVYGFNNKNYDNFLIQDILLSRDESYIKLKSDAVIKKRPKTFFDFITFDLKESMDERFSLKKFESMAGLQVEESSIPFDYEGEFTLEQVLEVAKYNIIDLNATLVLEEHRRDYFDGKKLLVQEYGEPKRLNFSNGSTSAYYLMGREKLEGYKPKEPIIKGVPTDAKLFLESALHYSPIASRISDKGSREKYKKGVWDSCILEAHGNVYTFAWGGLHSAKGKIETNKRGTKKIQYEHVYEDDVEQWDVTSEFPSIMIRDELLGAVTPKFKKLVEERIKNKALGNSLAGTQKIVINSVYGLLRLMSSRLFNPESAIAVNVNGMVAIYNLADRLAKHGTIYQVNTDGVSFKRHPETTQEQLDTIRSEWETEFSLELELSKFNRLVQRHVNSYIAEYWDEKSQKMKLKLKGEVSHGNGADVTKASSPTIIDYMIVQYLMYNKPLFKSVTEGKFRDYCFTLKALKGKTQTGKMVDGEGNVFPNEVNRTYATKNGQKVLKEKKDGGAPAKFSDTPENMAIANYALPDAYPEDLDLSYYVQLAQSKLDAWK